MSSSGRISPAKGFDTFGVSVGAALVAGVLSIGIPFLAALTGTLAALAVASWVMVRGPPTVFWETFLPARRAIGLGILAGGAALFLFPPPLLATLRGPLLALTLLPLWWVERQGTRDAVGSEGST